MNGAEGLPRSRFGAVLREFRLAAGLSQEALAELAAMSAEGISALERGMNRAPQRQTLTLLIRALNLDPDQRRMLEAAAVRPSRPRRRSSLDARRHNLPRTFTHLYGRDREIQAVQSLVAVAPLVTLTGAGGVGKTRLAIETGMRLLDDFEDGIWFVDLAPIGDPRIVPSAAAALFGVTDSSERPLTETLANALRRKELLLIVDNCEHLVEVAADLITALVANCPNLRVLATSRQSLNLPGEQTYRVASLEVEPAIALFAEHAKRTSATFELSDQNRTAVGNVVRRLDGIALAIELAATHVKLLTVEQLEERLTERFHLLTGGSPVNLPRQQTMRATIDWSYDLLKADEQILFRRLAVFSGGFSVEAVGFICADETIDEWSVLDLLSSLVDKSMVVGEAADGVNRRYRLLESMREYAREKVANDPEQSRMRHRHAEYYASVAERAQAAFTAVQSTADWASSFEPEIENFRAVLDWTLVSGHDPLLGVRLLTSLQEFWILQGLTREALRYVQRALEKVQDLPLRFQAALWLTLARMQHEYHITPQVMLDAAIYACELYEALDERGELAIALRERGVARMKLSALAEAEIDFQRALEIFRKRDDLRMIVRTLANLGYLRQMQGRFADAQTIMHEVLELSIEIGDDRAATAISMNIAEADFALGKIESAVVRARQNLAHDVLLRRSAHLRSCQESNLAAYLFASGRDEEARTMALLALRESDYYYSAVPMQHLAAILAAGDPQRAAILLGYVNHMIEKTNFKRERTELYTYDRLIRVLRTQLTDDEISRLQQEGAAMSEEQVFKFARRR